MVDPGLELCALCATPIYDQFFCRILLDKVTSSFHEDCLSCATCKQPLNGSCFVRDGALFCKQDYDRHFRLSCAKCKTLLYPEDMIFREGNNNNSGQGRVFHYNCLTCSLCGLNLRQGDEYIVQQSSDEIVCKAHFDEVGIGGNSGVNVTAAAAAAGAAGAAVPSKVGGDEVFLELQRSSRDGRRGPKRPRTILTAIQRRQFKASFEVSPKPCRKVREALAKETGLSVRVVQVWFQNQRAKMKKMHRRGTSSGSGKGGGGDQSSSKPSEDESLLSDDDDLDDCVGGVSGIPGGIPGGGGGAENANPFKSYVEAETSTPIDKLYLMQDSYFSQGQ